MTGGGSIRFRPARDADVPRIREIIARIYADYGDVLDIEREDPHLQDPCAYFRRTGGELWVAEVEAVPSPIVAGSGGVVLRDGEAEIKTVYVAHDHRRRGIARGLVKLAMNHAREVGARTVAPRRIMLWSDTRFVEAHALYESLGFIRGEVRHVRIVNAFSEYRFDFVNS
ncbi:MAG: GNAT family N-acetyltransferase [Phycisphaerales bacterium]